MNQHQPTNRRDASSAPGEAASSVPAAPERGCAGAGGCGSLLPPVDVVFPLAGFKVDLPPATALALLRSEVRYAYRAIVAAIECMASQQNDYMKMVNGEVLPSFAQSLLRAVEGSDAMSRGLQKMYEAQYGEGDAWQQGLLDDGG